MTSLRYKDLEEMTIAQWNGEKFAAVVTDRPEDLVSLDSTKVLSGCVQPQNTIIGYLNGVWRDESGFSFFHAYPVQLNELKSRRLTNRELARWLAEGNGEWAFFSSSDCAVKQTYSYNSDFANDTVPDNIRVRKWDTTEWTDPTIDLFLKD